MKDEWVDDGYCIFVGPDGSRCDRARVNRQHCEAHKSQFSARGKDPSRLTPLSPLKEHEKKTCVFSGCDFPCEKSSEYCVRHTRQLSWHKGDVKKLKPLKPQLRRLEKGEICIFPGCTKLAKSRYERHGPYCGGHHSQAMRSGGDFSKMVPIVMTQNFLKEGEMCSFVDPKTREQCRRLAETRLIENLEYGPVCTSHYRQYHNRGQNTSRLTLLIDVKQRQVDNEKAYLDYFQICWPDISKDEIMERWKAVGIERAGGPFSRYKKRISVNLKYRGRGWRIKFFSRHLMEMKEGRLLSSGEHVDHIDEDSSNDHIDNLQILTPVENVKKHYRHRRKKEGWDEPWCEQECVVCGRSFESRTSKVRTSWGGRSTGLFTCSRSCGTVYSTIIRRIDRWAGFLSRNFQCLVGRCLTLRSTAEDRENFRNKQFPITKLVRERRERLQSEFDELVKHHVPDAKKKTSEYRSSLYRFLLTRRNEYGNEDWRSFYRRFLTEMSTMTEEERLEFLFRVVYPFDQYHRSKMAWRLFNVL